MVVSLGRATAVAADLGASASGALSMEDGSATRGFDRRCKRLRQRTDGCVLVIILVAVPIDQAHTFRRDIQPRT